jgi:hypothetical protein
MDIKRIIREELELTGLEWMDEIDPYSFIKNYYEKFPKEYRASKMADDYAHLRSDKRNLKSILLSMGYDGTVDEGLMLSALIKYYKENTSLLKRFWSRFMYDDLKYISQNLDDDLFESTKGDFGFVDDTPELDGVSFKVKDGNDREQIYHIKDNGGNVITVKWISRHGNNESTTYIREIATEFFNTKEWIQID